MTELKNTRSPDGGSETAPFHNLVREERLLESLSPLWRRRFTRALELIHDGIDETIAWEQIASDCAISPFHFHRMFLAVFGQPPGQYIRRQRLEYAVEMLFEDDNLSVTEVAHHTGFSSSQALAKALKRDFGISATEVRKMRALGAAELERRFERLAVKDQAYKEEAKWADGIDFDLQRWPMISLKTLPIKTMGLQDTLLAATRLKADRNPPLYIIASNRDMDLPFEQLGGLAGVEDERGGYRLQEAQFLYGRVRVSSTSSGLAAWDALYKAMLALDCEPEEEGVFVEIVHNCDRLIEDAWDMTLALQVRPVVALANGS